MIKYIIVIYLISCASINAQTFKPEKDSSNRSQTRKKVSAQSPEVNSSDEKVQSSEKSIKVLASLINSNDFVTFKEAEALYNGSVWMQRTGKVTASSPGYGGILLPGRPGFYYERQFTGAVNVKWFGAKGDSTTDDTRAFTAALATGNSVFVPKGRYKVSSTLDVRLQNLTGDGWRNTILFSIDPITIVSCESSTTISDLQINGSGKAVAGLSLPAKGVNRCLATRIRVENCFHGIELLDTQNSMLLDCFSQYNNINYYIDGAENCKLINCNGNLSKNGDARGRNVFVTDSLHGRARNLFFIGGIFERGNLKNHYSVELGGTNVTFTSVEFNGGMKATIRQNANVTATYRDCAWTLSGQNKAIESDNSSYFNVYNQAISGANARSFSSLTSGGITEPPVLFEHKFDYSNQGWGSINAGKFKHNVDTKSLECSSSATEQGVRFIYSATPLDPDFLKGRWYIIECITSNISTDSPLHMYIGSSENNSKRLLGKMVSGYNKVAVPANLKDNFTFQITGGENREKTFSINYIKISLK